MLHAGGKFGGEGYKISGGLHGVGVSVVNALSRRLELEIERDGGRWCRLRRRGEPTGPLRRIADSDGHGTTVTFWPDGTIMEELEFRAQTLLERLREMAFLNKNLEIVFRDERVDPPTEQVFRYEGIVDCRRAPQRVEGAAVQSSDRVRRQGVLRRSRVRAAVEHRLLRGPALVREQHPRPPRAGCTRKASRRRSRTS